MATSTNPAGAAKPVKIILPGTKYHRVRKTVQLICFLIFILLPLFNIVRFDIPHERFYFFGAELWISEFSIIFLALIFLMFTIAAVAMLYGRIYCGYLCPQMIFSEAANTVQSFITRNVNRKLSKLSTLTRRTVGTSVFSLVLLPAAVFVSFVFISFFVQPVDLFHRLISLDIRTSGGILGASVTLVTLLDFAFLRQRFCTAICPYGYLQNMLADSHTLLVHFHDATGKCIHCDKCVRACPMGIDIRKSSHQLECTHCAECIDACSGILGKLGRTCLIQYAWGNAENNAVEEHVWYRRIGLRDGKRIMVLLLMLLYASGLSIAISLRQPVLVRIMPNRITLYTKAPDGLIHNRFRLIAINRGKKEATVTITLADLPAAHLVGMQDGLVLQPGQSVQQEFEIAAPANAVTPGINHLRILTQVLPVQKPGEFDETFIAPMESAPLAAPGAKP